MGKTRGMGAARKLKKFGINQMRCKRINQSLKVNPWERWPRMSFAATKQPNSHICNKCGSRVPKQVKELKKPKIGVDAYNSFISKCIKFRLIKGENMVNIFFHNHNNGGLKYIEEDVLIAAFDREGDALDISGLEFKTLPYHASMKNPRS